MLTKLKNRLYSYVTTKKLERQGVAATVIDSPFESKSSVAVSHLFIAPANSAGQGWAWARAAEKSAAAHGERVTAKNMQFVHGDEVFNYPADQAVHTGIGAHSQKWQKNQFASLQNFNHIIAESAEPLLGSYKNYDVSAQLQELQQKGATLALLFHGSDLRDPDRHIKNNKNSYFKVDQNFAELMRIKTGKSQHLIKTSGLPVFVSTPDLLEYAPQATWLPVVVETKKWQTQTVPFAGSASDKKANKNKTLPKIVHAPSKSFIKGSDLIDPVLEKLHQEGAIEYVRVTGVSHNDMIKIYKTADIVIDQVRGGPYGVAACEAMAAGRVVISHVPQALRETVLNLTGMQLPIIEAEAAELRNVILETINNTEAARQTAAKGLEYVQKIHDGTKSGAILRDWIRGEL